ncbi:hypothetical protein PY365_08490 [Roseiarcaceae bacterium H3SJ34-1]|uniref:hypothetical protein n=1 Tax=Terripilifer ovatus TaxID=3032367 RepID=UPI003AB93495|nr:hypothetical protein [Roseiarcaceae bacterium H3SJ34-1]
MFAKSRMRLFIVAATFFAAAGAHAAPASCADFQDAFARAVPELKPQFTRSVVIGGRSGETRELTTATRVEGRLVCDGQRFVRFETQIQMPSDPATRDAFYRIQEAGILAAMKWPRTRAGQVLLSMAGEAAEYLRASEERGDVYVAGKVEHHAGAAGDLAMMWTKADRTFIILPYE